MKLAEQIRPDVIVMDLAMPQLNGIEATGQIRQFLPDVRIVGLSMHEETDMAQAMLDPIFLACLAIAEQDAPSVGDLCLRCHTPGGWLEGRSVDTGGGLLIEKDLQGVQCDFCHRLVDPDYKPGISPIWDQGVLDSLDAVPLASANGQFVTDPYPARRGRAAGISYRMSDRAASSKLARSGNQRVGRPSVATLLSEAQGWSGRAYSWIALASCMASSPGSASRRSTRQLPPSGHSRSNTMVRTPSGIQPCRVSA